MGGHRHRQRSSKADVDADAGEPLPPCALALSSVHACPPSHASLHGVHASPLAGAAECVRARTSTGRLRATVRAGTAQHAAARVKAQAGPAQDSAGQRRTAQDSTGQHRGLGSGSGVGSFSQKGEFSNIPLFLAKCRPVVDVTATKCTPVVTPGAAGRRWHRESGGRPRVRPPGVCCRRPACCTSSPAKGSWFSSGKSRKSGTSSCWLGLGRRQQMGSCRSTAAN